jgi:hypothetical protein
VRVLDASFCGDAKANPGIGLDFGKMDGKLTLAPLVSAPVVHALKGPYICIRERIKHSMLGPVCGVANNYSTMSLVPTN